MNQPISFVDSGSYPTRAGNLVRPLIDGVPAFRRICEAIEGAQTSVWSTITFMWPGFEMPDDRGTALQVFERAARRGVDVRLIFWRPEVRMENHRRNAFWGSQDHFALLAEQCPNVNIRWDQAAPGYCQHQKTWLVDGDRDSATSFVGGINLNPNSLVLPGHVGSGDQNHDVYVEVRGPAVVDVQHNFVQRWNEASERAREDGHWGERALQDLRFPTRVPAACGTAEVQIQRTTHKGLYTNGHSAAACLGSFDIASGERTNLEQYCAAIAAAKRTIYMENQYVEVTAIVAALESAVQRGVEVVLVLPAVPDFPVGGELSEERRGFRDLRAGLAQYHNFTLIGLAAMSRDSVRQPVYVHSKLLLIDDVFASVGSCNLHHHSLYGNGELNAAVSDADSVKAIRVELLQEHLAQDTSFLDDVQALQQLKAAARNNRLLHDKGLTNWRGLVFSMSPESYGQQRQL